MEIVRGDVIIVDLGDGHETSIQSGIRPVVVMSNDKSNKYSSILTVVPCTTKIHKKRYLPTHVSVWWRDLKNSNRCNLALCEQVTCVAKENVIEKYGSVDKKAIKSIERAVQIQMGIEM